MLFHVHMTVQLPPDLDPTTRATLSEAEHVRAKEIQEAGKWRHLWRVAGTFQNISIFDVADPAELHDLISSLPFYPYMQIEVTALCHHPGSIHSDD
ncbi:muconolactone Delta-isomerase [Streptomyces mirabilis]|uniref:muconolactone Delta-isomerase n=1 Tax=Streptomyces mirabilis TaxID=68239 RepID=UPI0036CBBE54